jgi:hypothetical protein
MRTMTIAAFTGSLAFMLSSPALAQAPAPAPSKQHYQCYQVTQTSRLSPQAPKLTDQFGESNPRLGPATMLCAPVEKNGEPMTDKETHLVCYTIRGRNAQKAVSVDHQFGTQTLRVTRGSQLCLPATKKLL